MVRKITNRLSLDDFMDDHSSLIAIHSPLELFRLVYFVNGGLGLSLARTQSDVDFKQNERLSFYRLYHYCEPETLNDFYMVANKSKSNPVSLNGNGSLFPDENDYLAFLVPERKKVDYFLKIKGADSPKDYFLKLKTIKQITTAYIIDVNTLKSYKNLIFD